MVWFFRLEVPGLPPPGEDPRLFVVGAATVPEATRQAFAFVEVLKRAPERTG